MPTRYYTSEIVSKGKDGIIGFQIVCIDRLIPGKPQGALFVAGKFNSGTGEVVLMNATTGKLVPVVQHPLFRKSPNT